MDKEDVYVVLESEDVESALRKKVPGALEMSTDAVVNYMVDPREDDNNSGYETEEELNSVGIIANQRVQAQDSNTDDGESISYKSSDGRLIEMALDRTLGSYSGIVVDGSTGEEFGEVSPKKEVSLHYDFQPGGGR